MENKENMKKTDKTNMGYEENLVVPFSAQAIVTGKQIGRAHV